MDWRCRMMRKTDFAGVFQLLQSVHRGKYPHGSRRFVDREALRGKSQGVTCGIQSNSTETRTGLASVPFCELAGSGVVVRRDC
jgi:hypothetical protein